MALTRSTAAPSRRDSASKAVSGKSSPGSGKPVKGNAGPEVPKGMKARVEQVKSAWTMTRAEDPKLPLVVGIPALVLLAILVVVGLVVGHVIVFTVIGVILATMLGTTIFGRRATATMYARVEGQVGAGAAVLQGMRGDWRVTPAVGFTRNQDLLHRVIGRCGIVLVGEGSSTAALHGLIVDQKRRIGRVAPETPIHDFLVGNGEGEIPIPKLQQTIMKLPRVLKQTEINAVESRLRALGAAAPPVPKGPMPTRMPRKQR